MSLARVNGQQLHLSWNVVVTYTIARRVGTALLCPHTNQHMVSSPQGREGLGPAGSQRVARADALLLTVHELYDGEATLCVPNDKTCMYVGRRVDACDIDKVE